jgi:hypothetical protein
MEESVAAFGKHKGKTAVWVMKNDPSYWNWAAKAVPDLFKGTPPQGKGKTEVPQDTDAERVRTWLSPSAMYSVALAYHKSQGEDI